MMDVVFTEGELRALYRFACAQAWREHPYVDPSLCAQDWLRLSQKLGEAVKQARAIEDAHRAYNARLAADDAAGAQL